MTDFFERQNIARRKTKLLLCYFLPSVALTIIGVYFIALFLLVYFTHRYPHHYDFSRHLFEPSNINWHVMGWVAAITALVVTLASLSKARQLADGGPAVAAMLGGRRVLPNTTDPDERRLRDIVEEMSIASGVPVPEIFLLDDEDCINAFVAGHNSSDAALGVTNGAMRLLNRDELQAVIGHEFSHLLNGDMQLNLWLMSFLYGILFIALTGKLILNAESEICSRSRRAGRGTAGIFVVGVGLFVIGSVGYFFGRLIKCAVCRERECLADAAAVQFTRNPLALAAALKKIGGLASGSRIIGAGADEASHLFFSDVMPDSFAGMFSTHPPLVERIRLLEPSFNGKFEYVKSLPAQRRDSGETPKPIKSIMDVPGITRMPPEEIVQIAAVLNDRKPVVQNRPFTPRHLTYAASLSASIPPQIADAAREPFGASALIYAILLLPDQAARAKQIAEVQPIAEAAMLSSAQSYFSTVCAMTNGQKLALISLAMPTLRQMSAAQYENFSKTVKLLVESDSEISLFEYGLQKSLLRYLEPRFKPTKPPIAQYYAAAGLGPECAVLFSALAYESSDNNSEITSAFQCGAQQLDLPPAKQIYLLSREDCNLPQVDAVIAKLSQAALPVKREIITACAMVVASDSLVKEEEAEMLRAIADAMGCPLPPFVSAIAIPEAA